MSKAVTLFVCALACVVSTAYAAPPASLDDARKAFNAALKNNSHKALAELVGDGTLVLKRYGDKTRYKKAKILKSNMLNEDLMDPIPNGAKCRKTTCKWKEEEYCSHADGIFKVTFKKRKGVLALTGYNFDCK